MQHRKRRRRSNLGCLQTTAVSLGTTLATTLGLSAVLSGCASDHFLGQLPPADLALDGNASTTQSHEDLTIGPLLGAPDVSMGEDGWFGPSQVASVGDVDGDGYGDFVSRSWDSSSFTHYLHLRYGGPRPQRPEDAFALSEGGARLTLPPLGHLLETLIAAGDVDGDGYADFLVGLGRCNPTQEGEGAYLVYGGSARLDGVQRLVDTAVFLKSPRPLGPQLGLGSCSAQLNSFVGGLGDVDGDGLDDFMVSEPRLIPLDNYPEPSPVVESVAYLFYGRRARLPTGTSLAAADARLHAAQDLYVTPTGDANADGLGDVVLGGYGYERAAVAERDQPLAGDWWDAPAPTAFYWLPGQAERWSGDVSLDAAATRLRATQAAGDLDGDGVSDVLVYDDNHVPHLFYGGPGLFEHGADFAEAAASFDAYGDETAGVLLRLNDRDGDGDDELVLQQWDRQRSVGAGAVALLSGTSARRSGDIQLLGSNPFPSDSGRFLEGIFPVGDLDGDGAGDLITRSGVYSAGPRADGYYDIPSLQLHRVDAAPTLLHIHYGKPGSSSRPLH
jgi:hypothetical protein